MKTSKKRMQVGVGELCPRCKQQSVRFEHPPDFTPPTDKGWYSFWFECPNPRCITTTFMKGGFNPCGSVGHPAGGERPKISAPNRREFQIDWSDTWPAMIAQDDRPPWE